MKAVVTITPKLKASIISGDLLKQISKMQLDSSDIVRSVATGSIANLAPFLETSLVKKFLLAGYCRALQDSNGNCRFAAVTGLLGTIQMYSAEDLANNLISQISPLLVDNCR